ncbi:MAG: type 4a pilus biogenesis protein PilO [Immundisolibacteraceae bacterium]|nr:type 4a pilus biogenesis protein PilO [Immundisolibacteraceae bacterium]
MNLNDLREIDFSEIELSNTGDWPLVIKGAATLLLAILVLVGGYFLLTKDTLTELEKVQKEELALRDTFVAKYRKAINLASYKLQLEEMKETFSALTRQLPDKTQVADLLVEITQAGLGHGLEFDLFEPKSEKPAEFYAELPISIKVTGQYHQVAEFVSDVAAFPRIVTMHDLQMKKSGEKLVMTGIAKTYRYLDEDK